MLVPAYKPDGTLFDLACVTVEDIDWAAMAAALSKLARFNGIYPCMAYSVAQHSVMGADALFEETGDSALAGYFVLHDGHEYILGDQTRPVLQRLQVELDRIAARDTITAGQREFVTGLARRAMSAIKAEVDAVVHTAANLPALALMPIYARQVAEMDERMLVAEIKALFGPGADPRGMPQGDFKAPRLRGAIRPWGAAKAEEAFVDRLEKYLGIVVERGR